MEKSDIKDYRKILEKEFVDKDLEIDTTLSYISVGSLGFFLTINDSLFGLKEANYKAVFIFSIIFITTSFILLLFRKAKTSSYDLKLMRFVDGMRENSDEDDTELYKLWEKTHNSLTTIRKFIFLSISLGVILQVLFIILNI